MDTVVELSWRAYPGGALMALGFGAALYGVRRLAVWWRTSAFDGRKALVFVAGMRAILVGFAIAGVGAAWIWQQFWVLLIALAIGGEELLETSFVLFILRRAQRKEEERNEHQAGPSQLSRASTS